MLKIIERLIDKYIKPAMPLNLLLVRHGESEGNVVNKGYAETRDESLFSEIFSAIHESQYELTPKGIEQATLAGAWLKENWNKPFFRMMVSSNKRAMQTAAYLDLPNVLWNIDHNLRERENGLFNGMSPAKIQAEYSAEQFFHDSQPFLFRPPQGESMSDVCRRIKIILDTLARECNGKDVVIVCHGHVMRAFRIILERMSPKMSNELLSTKEQWGRIPNCSILHYTRNSDSGITDHFNSFRLICPAGGGELVGPFQKIERKKFTNAELLKEAQR